MKSQWSDADAQAAIEAYAKDGVSEDLALRTYSARLIGSDPELVLHGGGNTSVKSQVTDILGRDVPVIHVKGSGWDLATIEPPGHPALRLEPLLELRAIPKMTDEEMVSQQRSCLMDPYAPNPSVETLLHAFLPHKFVDHTHANAILSLVDQANAEELVREVYGSELGIVPYVMPGFDLSHVAMRSFDEDPDVKGLVLLQHGLFTFADDARESYELMIEMVDRAEQFIASKRSSTVSVPAIESGRPYTEVAPILRGALAEPVARSGDRYDRFVLELRNTDAVMDFVNAADLSDVSQRGTATPDHVIRTKRLPLVLHDLDAIPEAVDAYREQYAAEFQSNCKARVVEKQELDRTPRIALIPGVGLVGIGRDPKAAAIAADIYEHTISIIRGAEAVGSFFPLTPVDLFDVEYWSLEQAKLAKSVPKAMSGTVVLVTGAGSGLGAATASAFSAQGAVVVLWDLNRAAAESIAAGLSGATLVDEVDVTDLNAVRMGMRRIVERFGGLDTVVSNAGAAWTSAMGEVDDATFRKSFELNFFSHQTVAAEAVAVMVAQGTGGCLLFNASKAAFQPGVGMGPYAIPKAGVIALMKQYALEYGEHGVRSNAVNADRVQTGLFEDGMLEARAQARGVSVEEYLSGNLLGREVLAEHVADAFVHLACSHTTTAATLPVDGGNLAAAPR